MTSRRELANAIRALSMDAVQKANSGHPGAPMGMADIAEVLWNDFMAHNPTNPKWSNRDRFVLSNGHGSMLIYSLLHLTGYDLPIEELKNFRQLHSKTPGHPEYGYAPGVETTTGPLGQGITNAVGMAIAEKALAAQFNKDGHKIVNHHTYVFMGDGCLMEGISHEACSLAGTLGLGNLIAFWDDNGISIDGHVDGWFTDNTPMRFESYGWHVIADVDGHDSHAISKAIELAKVMTDKPTLICCKTTIGFGSPNKSGSHACHGAPLGDAEINLTKAALGWDYGSFEIPAHVYAGWDAKVKGTKAEQDWNEKFAAYKKAYPELAAEYERRMVGELPENWSEGANKFISAVNDEAKTTATRLSSLAAIEGYAKLLPEIFGGSADLGCSNMTEWSGYKPMRANKPDANYVNYGVREFGMSAIMNGVALHGGLIPFGATFLMFSEYARNAVRMASLMKIRSIFVYTHDSIGLGEDGPTHQPIEQTATLRLIPNMQVWRPCDAVETSVAWRSAIERKDGPSVLVFSRQNLTHVPRNQEQIDAISRGAYIVADSEGVADAIIIATGSEVELALKAAEQLKASGKNIRVVSMPSTNIFDAQDSAYRESVLPSTVTKRVAVEAGVTDGWWKYVGTNGKIVGIDHFGESAPAGLLFKEFGFTVENVVKNVEAVFQN
ncbi:MAG: transketolase [Methylovulum sp.]|uniref:transketolase n=1 Tax=Methylovulum sp. TaxID=1916980 RepID=UPI0026121FE9|nr:transketolase [Methylovulum sp.]MDD2724466.1 transketolase [Methylovulum sp.]MDD5126235.1 transketolase [Methylovulum sp.]